MSGRKEALEALRDKVNAGDDDPLAYYASRAFQNGYAHAINAYNGSLDAAKSLHDAVLPGWFVYDMGNISRSMGWAVILVSRGGDYASSHQGRDDRQESPARAWLLAILSALISEATG